MYLLDVNIRDIIRLRINYTSGGDADDAKSVNHILAIVVELVFAYTFVINLI